MLETLFNTTWAWIIGGAVLIGLEIVAPGVYLLWIGLGALATGLILAIVPDLAVAWQLLVFAVAMLSSITLGFFVQRRSSRLNEAKFLNRELQAMVGRTYTAITDFEAGRGRIKVADSSYAAIARMPVKSGDLVEVVEIDTASGQPVVARADAPRQG